MDDIEMIKKCQLGDMDAFRILFKHMEQKAFGTAYLISGKRGIAEDIVQETFVCCIEKIKTLKNPDAFHVWFYRMMVRIGWRMVKSHGRYIPTEEIQDQRHASSTEEEVHQNIVDEKLRNAIRQLSDSLRTVIVLYYFNGMKIEEIAKVTGSFKATVKTRLHYARKVLKDKLQEGEPLGREFGYCPQNIR